MTEFMYQVAGGQLVIDGVVFFHAPIGVERATMAEIVRHLNTQCPSETVEHFYMEDGELTWKRRGALANKHVSVSSGGLTIVYNDPAGAYGDLPKE